MSTTSNTHLRHEPQLTLSPTILTKVTTRSGMAIFKLDKIAVTHLRTAGLAHPFHRHYYHWSTTGLLDLQPREMAPFRVAVKIYWNGCYKQKNNKCLSIFAENQEPDHKPLLTPFIVKLFVQKFQNQKWRVDAS